MYEIAAFCQHKKNTSVACAVSQIKIHYSGDLNGYNKVNIFPKNIAMALSFLQGNLWNDEVVFVATLF